MITPPIVPVSHAPARCPKCGAIEDKVEVCKNCRYEYPKDNGDSFWFVLAILAIIFAFVWIVITLVAWASGGMYGWPEYGHVTLRDVLSHEWGFIREQMHRIW